MNRLEKQVIETRCCTVPWMHTEISFQNDVITPCCKYVGRAGKVSDGFEQVWNGNEYSTIRAEFLNGNLPQGCQRACSAKPPSFNYKDYKNKQYFPLIKDVDADNPPLPQFVHLTLKNVCNLACRMCHPRTSSKFFPILKKSQYLDEFYDYADVDNKFNVNNLRGTFKNARRVVISGGEPLIDEDCIRLLEIVREESPHLEAIVFSSNMTLLNPQLIKMLADMKSVEVYINCSIDGPPKIHEYIRTYCNWQDIVENLKSLSVYRNFGFGFNTTISALNVGYIPEIIDTYEQLRLETGVKFSRVMPTPVLESHTHPTVLPNEVRAMYLEKLNAYKLTSKLENVHQLIESARDFLTRPQGDYALFQKFTSEFDRATGTSLYNVYPELVPLPGIEPGSTL